jgi:hypothetical protein
MYPAKGAFVAIEHWFAVGWISSAFGRASRAETVVRSRNGYKVRA